MFFSSSSSRLSTNSENHSVYCKNEFGLVERSSVIVIVDDQIRKEWRTTILVILINRCLSFTTCRFRCCCCCCCFSISGVFILSFQSPYLFLVLLEFRLFARKVFHDGLVKSWSKSVGIFFMRAIGKNWRKTTKNSVWSYFSGIQ